MKPRTVCACHFVTAMISASVAPLARFISAITSAFLLARSAFGLPAAFLDRPAFFAGLILAAVRLAFACVAPGSGVVVFSDIGCVRVHRVSPDRVAVVTSITQVRRNCNRNLWRLGGAASLAVGMTANWRVGSLFYMPDKTRTVSDCKRLLLAAWIRSPKNAGPQTLICSVVRLAQMLLSP